MAVIARRFGISTQALLSANGIADANRIYAGQNLSIPGSAAAAANESESPPADTPVLADAGVQNDSNDARRAASDTAGDSSAPIQRASVLEPIIATGVAVLEQIVSNAEATEAAPVSIDLGADPSNYSVADDGTIEVQAHETLGHYADWLGIPTQALRDLNGLPYGRAVNFGQRIRLRFDGIDRDTFEQRRMQYQQQIQEDFFTEYHIADVTEHVVRPGESLWILANRRYNVPVWLLRQYNPDVDLDRISPGTVVKFPNLRRIADDA